MCHATKRKKRVIKFILSQPSGCYKYKCTPRMTRHDFFLCRTASADSSTIGPVSELPREVVHVSVFTPPLGISAADPGVLAHAGAKHRCKLFCKRDC